jgi:peptide/nickel transport system permease protein
MTEIAAPLSPSGTPVGAVAPPALSTRTLWRRYFSSRVSTSAFAVLVLLLVLTAFGPALAPYPQHITGTVATANRFEPPSSTHLFGTNELGQDVLSLVLGGARVSILTAIAIIASSALIGTIVGALAGFFGRLADEVLMRFTDLMLTIPSLILAMAVAAALGPGIANLIIAITLATWPGYARLVRGEVRAVKLELYVEAAMAMGASPWRILLRHVLPNIAPTIIVKMSLEISFAIITVASLGFIGIGVKPPTPEWGAMLSNARGYMPGYWWIAIFPGLAIMISVFAFNLFGDGLREALDPKSDR